MIHSLIPTLVQKKHYNFTFIFFLNDSKLLFFFFVDGFLQIKVNCSFIIKPSSLFRWLENKRHKDSHPRTSSHHYLGNNRTT